MCSSDLAAGVSGAAAYLLVRPLSALVWTGGSIVPLLFAALVAMYVGLLFNAVERWVNGDRTRWAFARDAVDTRRIVVAMVSAVIAWLVSVVAVWVGDSSSTSTIASCAERVTTRRSTCWGCVMRATPTFTTIRCWAIGRVGWCAAPTIRQKPTC